jgi:hypothetical protein
MMIWQGLGLLVIMILLAAMFIAVPCRRRYSRSALRAFFP